MGLRATLTVDRAIGLGWPPERVQVIDEDLGKSGAGGVDRHGFQKLIAEIGLGNAGLVVSLDASRLARNNRDWHQLLELGNARRRRGANCGCRCRPGSSTIERAQLFSIRMRRCGPVFISCLLNSGNCKARAV